MADSAERIEAIEQHLDEQEAIYRERTATSFAALRQGAHRMPLAVASSFQSHYPYPLVMEQGEGCWLTDLDGNRYLDLHAGFGAMVYGNAHPRIVSAIQEQAARGTHYATPVPGLADYAEQLCQRFQMQQVRFCSSGSEATMDAIRIARAFTGREAIVKIEGSYHGHHDTAMVSVKPDLSQVGFPYVPNSVPASEGIPHDAVRIVWPVPFNNLKALEDALRFRKIACVILEPVLCNLGMVMPQPGYLEAVRELCDRYQAVLIYDEVKTGLTIGWGGAVERFGVQPDLVCLGKAIGGGLPVGAFGGRKDLMDLIENWRTPHYGTFSGNPLVVAAGLAALGLMSEEEYPRMEKLGQRMVEGVQSSAQRLGLDCHSLVMGAKGGVFFSSQPPQEYREWVRVTDTRLAQLCWLFMVNRGVWAAPGADEQWTLSLPMGETEAEHYLAAWEAFAQVASRLPAR